MQKLNRYIQGSRETSEVVDNNQYSTAGQYGLKKCFGGDNAVVDIVLVHGLTGNRETTWTDKRTEVFWAEHLLKNDIPEARILTFGYDADIVHFWASASQNRLGNHAQNLANALSQLRERSGTNDRAIIFVAHSLGGLVVEDALLTSKNSAEPHIRQLVECTAGIAFLGTPHCGSDLGTWAKVFGHFADVIKKTNTDLLGTLRPQSEVLARVQQEFHTMLRARRDDGKLVLSICCFYEELPVKGVGQIVPMHSAILPAYNSIGIRNNHMDMTKFSSEQDLGYLAVSNELWRWVKDVKTRKQAEEGSRYAANNSAFNQNQRGGFPDQMSRTYGSQQVYNAGSYAPPSAYPASLSSANHTPDPNYNDPRQIAGHHPPPQMPAGYSPNEPPYGLTQNNYYQNNNNFQSGYNRPSLEPWERVSRPPQQMLPSPSPSEDRVIQHGNYIGDQNVSGTGKVVSGNNFRSEQGLTFNL